MMTPIVFVGGDPYVMDDEGNLTRKRYFYGNSTDCTFSGEVITDFPHIELAHNADEIYLMDTRQVFLFDEDTKTGLPQ